jgi:hypothetical protein
MDVLTKGTPVRLDQVPNGKCFAFETGNQIAIGIKIAYPQSPNSRVLVLTRAVGQPPSLQGRQEPKPTIVYQQPAMAFVTSTTPGHLRNGVANPRPGQVMQFEEEVYIGFLDEHNDPSSVSLKTGLINPNHIDGPTAIFDTWQVAFNGGGEPEIVFSYKPAPQRA